MQRYTKRLIFAICFIAACLAAGGWSFGQTHNFNAALNGYASYLYDTNTVTTTYVHSEGKINNFDAHAAAEIRFDGQEPEGPVTGQFYATRFVSNGKRGSFEQLYGTVVGTATRVGDLWHYTGTITIYDGSGRLAGATGTITFDAHQYGAIDPNFVLTPNQVLADATYDGTYTVP